MRQRDLVIGAGFPVEHIPVHEIGGHPGGRTPSGIVFSGDYFYGDYYTINRVRLFGEPSIDNSAGILLDNNIGSPTQEITFRYLPQAKSWVVFYNCCSFSSFPREDCSAFIFKYLVNYCASDSCSSFRIWHIATIWVFFANYTRNTTIAEASAAI